MEENKIKQREDPLKLKEIYLARLRLALAAYRFENLGDFNSFDGHVRNIINLYQGLLIDTLQTQDLEVDGRELGSGDYHLKVVLANQTYHLKANKTDTKEDIAKEIKTKIIKPTQMGERYRS